MSICTSRTTSISKATPMRMPLTTRCVHLFMRACMCACSCARACVRRSMCECVHVHLIISRVLSSSSPAAVTSLGQSFGISRTPMAPYGTAFGPSTSQSAEHCISKARRNCKIRRGVQRLLCVRPVRGSSKRSTSRLLVDLVKFEAFCKLYRDFQVHWPETLDSELLSSLADCISKVESAACDLPPGHWMLSFESLSAPAS